MSLGVRSLSIYNKHQLNVRESLTVNNIKNNYEFISAHVRRRTMRTRKMYIVCLTRIYVNVHINKHIVSTYHRP